MEKFEPSNLIAQSSVKMHRLMGTVQAMLVTGKGLLAMDESIATCNQRFAKWRAVFQVDDVRLPTAACIDANAHALARYAVLCQEAGLVPIIEAEVLMNGDHTLERCQEVTETVLRRVFCQLAVQGTQLEAMILKPNMVIAGLTCTVQNSAEQVADATLRCLRRVVPACVPGIMFLSGGQSGEEASSRLNAMQIRHGLMPLTMTADAATTRQPLPWPLSFSFARALQHPALEIWSGQERNRVAAQQALIQRAQCNSAALKGEYIADSQGRR